MPSLQDLRIVFFGTPHFAVASLASLVGSGLNVVAVVTAPDKPTGRGLQLSGTPVKEYALQHNIPILQPPKLKDKAFLDHLSSLHADVQVVVAFRMLPEAVWAMPPMGTINVHASLLPQYRGAAPINWAIINGEKETGVTTFRLKHAIDTGDMLLQSPVVISLTDNAGTLHDKLMAEGAALLLKTLEGLAAGGIQPKPQPEAVDLKHAPKIFKEDTRINWNAPSGHVYNFIRGLSPHPSAFTILHEKAVRIFSAIYEEGETGVQPGRVESDRKTFLRIAATDGWIYLQEVQQEGKKRMDIEAFLRGFRL